MVVVLCLIVLWREWTKNNGPKKTLQDSVSLFVVVLGSIVPFVSTFACTVSNVDYVSLNLQYHFS